MCDNIRVYGNWHPDFLFRQVRVAGGSTRVAPVSGLQGNFWNSELGIKAARDLPGHLICLGPVIIAWAYILATRRFKFRPASFALPLSPLLNRLFRLGPVFVFGPLNLLGSHFHCRAPRDGQPGTRPGQYTGSPKLHASLTARHKEPGNTWKKRSPKRGRL